MIHTKIIIQSVADAQRGLQLVPGAKPEQFTEANDLTVAIQEHGTEGGQTTMMFILQMPSGEYHYAQISENIFEQLSGAFRGAQQRFGRAV